MAYVTMDKRVKKITTRMVRGEINPTQAREEIRTLPPEPGNEFGFLEWEVEEAIKAATA